MSGCVGRDHDAGARRLSADEPESGECIAVGEEAAPRSQNHRNVLGVRVRDIDCAFKLLRTDFLHEHPLETRGAMINAELLYKLKRADYSCREVGVHHLPRRGGRATGANLRVIARAFRELFIFARKWRHEDRAHMRLRATLAS